MSNISYHEYWQEIESIADDLASEAMDDCDNCREDAEEQIWDYRLHEAIDSHQWVIYTAYNLDVIQHSDNENYYEDNFGAECLAHSLKEGGPSTLHCHVAFWAMYGDVAEKISEALDNYDQDDAA